METIKRSPPLQTTLYTHPGSLPVLVVCDSDLYADMASIVKDNNSTPIIINGEKDHVHLYVMDYAPRYLWEDED